MGSVAAAMAERIEDEPAFDLRHAAPDKIPREDGPGAGRRPVDIVAKPMRFAKAMRLTEAEQRIDPDLAALRHQHSPVNHILQFTHIAAPWIGQQLPPRGFC